MKRKLISTLLQVGDSSSWMAGVQVALPAPSPLSSLLLVLHQSLLKPHPRQPHSTCLPAAWGVACPLAPTPVQAAGGQYPYRELWLSCLQVPLLPFLISKMEGPASRILVSLSLTFTLVNLLNHLSDPQDVF